MIQSKLNELVTCKYKKDWIKNNRGKVETSFSPMGAFCCYGNQSLDPICPKTLCSLSPTPVMLHIKFDQDWPTGFRDIQVWKCGRRTDDRPLVYYKLTLWAFGSGELTTKKRWRHYFPYYKSMGAFCCHGNQSFDPICPKTLRSLSPTPGCYI